MGNFTRRELLKLGAATAVAQLSSLGLAGCGGGPITFPSIPSFPSVCSKLTDIEHVIILIQENRSFDHYFGSYRGVRGFSDRSAAFQQPQTERDFLSYQLTRNVLAAYASGCAFCVLTDARRPELIEAWYAVMKCVRHVDLRTRCKVLTWQELGQAMPRGLREFLGEKYGM
jgi:phospholipase C